MTRTRLTILGSTGSIGRQALEVVREQPERFEVVALAAGRSGDLLAEQAAEFRPRVVCLTGAGPGSPVPPASPAPAGGPVEAPAGLRNGPWDLLAGGDGLAALATLPEADVVLVATSGRVALPATLAAVRAGKDVALANKESLVIAGELVAAAARRSGARLLPVDSEHSALWQCLSGEAPGTVRRMILTASGGPFRTWPADRLESVGTEQALAHPTWRMGPVITVNCATLVNKGLELIEAHLLFGVPFDRIGVVVHPQSVVHSMVEFTDGSTLAQASPPDMRIPIALALAWPDRVADAAPAVDWTIAHTWTFEPLDEHAFPAVSLAREAGRAGGTCPAAYNAANEECVAAFLAGTLSFTGIVDTVMRVISEHDGARQGAVSLEDVLNADRWARARARELTG